MIVTPNLDIETLPGILRFFLAAAAVPTLAALVFRGATLLVDELAWRRQKRLDPLAGDDDFFCDDRDLEDNP